MLFLGDCLEKMKLIGDNSVSLILTDPPYGTTQCKWDTVVPFAPMWAEFKRLSGLTVMTATDTRYRGGALRRMRTGFTPPKSRSL